MTVPFNTDAALLPLLGAFGEPVTLPNGSDVTAIVDFVEATDGSAFGKPIQPESWHFTMRATRAADLGNEAEVLYAGRLYRLRHRIPEGHGLTTLVGTRRGAPDVLADFDGDDFDGADFHVTYA